MNWYRCPTCGRKLFAVFPGAVVRGVQIKCKSCGKLIDVNI